MPASFHGIKTFFKLPLLDAESGVMPDFGDIGAVGFLGIPYDGGSSFRPGSRFGPGRVRESSVCARWQYNLLGASQLDERHAYDLGDVDVNPGADVAHAVAHRAAGFLHGGRNRLLGVGGDHSVSLGLLRAACAVHGPMSVLHFDAHADTDEGFNGSCFHGSWMRQAFQEGLVRPGGWIRVGARSEFGKEPDPAFPCHAFSTVECREAHTPAAIRRLLADTPTYVTIDLDAFDLSVAPGVASPVPDGLQTRDAAAVLAAVYGARVFGGDVVEYVPAYDHGDITGVLAAYLLHALMGLVRPAPSAACQPSKPAIS